MQHIANIHEEVVQTMLSNTTPSAPPLEGISNPDKLEPKVEDQKEGEEGKTDKEEYVKSVNFLSGVPLGISWIQNRVTELTTDSPAAKAGVSAGWTIVSVAGEGVPLDDRNFIKKIINKEKGNDIEIIFEKDDPKEDKEVRLPQYGDMRFARHLVSRDDSLYGLAGKYGCSISQFRFYNPSVIFDYLDNVHGDYIFIPIMRNDLVLKLDPVAIREREEFFKIRGFLIRGKYESIYVTKMEARYYLGENDWDLDKAVANWTEDIEWEKKNPFPKDTSLKTSDTSSKSKNSGSFLRRRRKAKENKVKTKEFEASKNIGIELGSIISSTSISTTTTTTTTTTSKTTIHPSKTTIN